jgi:DNA-binding NtrC family response regulator
VSASSGVEAREGNGEQEPSCELHGTVMVVDDDPAVLETMELALSCQGHQVVTAQSGRAAIETARSMDVDLVLTDFRMGDMDGLETMRAIKAIKPATRVMIITGFASAEMEEELKRSGAVAIVAKPFGLDDLYAAVRRALAV